MSQTISGTAPAFSAWQSSAQGVSASTWTKLNFQTEEFDVASNYDTTNMRFTPNVAGYYQVNANAMGNNNAQVITAIYKNGTEFKRGSQVYSTTGQGSNVAAIVYLNGTTDYIECWFYSTGSVQTIQAYQSITYFQAAMIRGA